MKWKEVKTAWREKADKTWHIYPSAGSLPKAMIEQFKAKGGTLLLQTPANKLIVKDGRVTGVVAKNKKGDTITVNAKNVILATGGYSFNTEMVKKYSGIDSVPVGAPGRTGDGINMAFEVGRRRRQHGPDDAQRRLHARRRRGDLQRQPTRRSARSSVRGSSMWTASATASSTRS